MKTAISVPDHIFKASERLARRLKLSRSELYARAVAEFVAAHTANDITERLNRVYSEVDSRVDPVLHELQLAALREEDW